MIFDYEPTSPLERVTPRIYDILKSYAFQQGEFSVTGYFKTGGLTADELINNGYYKFFNFEFPWYDETGRGLVEFEKNFLRKYMMHEIGQETEALFKLYLQSRLCIMMPGWKQLYDTMMLQYNPLLSVNVTKTDKTTETREENGKNDRTYNRTENRTNKTTTNEDLSNSNSNKTETSTQSIDSDNPQVTIATQDYASAMNRGQSEVDSTGTDKTERQATQNGTEKGTIADTDNTTTEKTGTATRENSITERGFTGSYQDAVRKQRELIVNLNKIIIDYMETLFLMVYE